MARCSASPAVCTADGTPVCRRCEIAGTAWTRLRGLLGRELAADDGLLIRPCRSVHMLFMRYPIDAVFLDGEHRVVRVVAALRPWRAASQRGARAVLELPAGAAARIGLVEGAALRLVPAGERR